MEQEHAIRNAEVFGDVHQLQLSHNTYRLTRFGEVCSQPQDKLKIDQHILHGLWMRAIPTADGQLAEYNKTDIVTNM